MAIFLGRFILLATAAIILAETLARIGIGFVNWADGKRIGGLQRFGVGYLLGLAIVGTALLGLASVGLFTGPMIITACLSLLLASHETWKTRPTVLEALNVYWTECRSGLFVLAAGGVPVVIWLLIPETEIDSYTYHLGIGGQLLQAHRLLLDHVAVNFRFPCLTEMSLALPLVLGDDRIGKWMMAASFGATCAVFASDALACRSKSSMWLGPLISLSTASVLWLVPITKSDIAAAGFFVAGALLIRRRQFLLASVLMGCSLSAKIVYGPVIAVWCLLHLPKARKMGGALLLMALPLAPWLLKEYLASGNPVYPFASGIFPTYGWGDENWKALRTCQKSLWAAGSWKPAEFLGTFWSYYRGEGIILGLALPGLAILGRWRKEIRICVLCQAVMLASGHICRYLLPATWLLCFFLALEAGKVSGSMRRRVTGVLLAAYSLAAIALGSETRRPLLRYAFTPLDAVLKEVLTTYGEAAGWLSARGTPRTILIGEMRTYRLPGRALYGGVFGETPIMWKLVRESRSGGDLCRKIRQLGADALLYNYVGVRWVQKYYTSFAWDERMMKLYKEYCLSHLALAKAGDTCDFTNGGFHLYKLTSSPLVPRQHYLYYPPGAESYYFEAANLMNSRDYRSAVKSYGALIKSNPEVLSFRADIGNCYHQLGDNSNAYRMLRPVIDHGMMDATSMPAYGTVSLNLGKYDEADIALRESLRRYPSLQHITRVNLGTLYFSMALNCANRNETGNAERLLDKAMDIMNFNASAADPIVEKTRQEKLAYSLGLRGDICRARGEREKAINLYREAFRIAPFLPGAEIWKQFAERLANPSRGKQPPHPTQIRQR